MKTFFAAALAAVASASPEKSKFMEYIINHGKSYGTVEEYEFRFNQWMETETLVNQHNSSNSTFTLAHNKFSDYTNAEYKRMLGYVAPTLMDSAEFTYNGEDLPTEVNWVVAGAVTPVKDQGQCGSCWAFSSTGALEGGNYIKTGTLDSFSEQELVDCVPLSFGCNGGNQATAFKYLKSHYAVLESDYAYTAKDGTCAYDSAKHTTIEDNGSTKVTANNPDAMKAALVNQPLAVSIEADTRYFQNYSSGVLDDAAKCGTSLDHAVLAVGYGVENGVEYWLVKNSWGTTWGEAGYIKLAIQDGAGVCGVQMGPLYPNL